MQEVPQTYDVSPADARELGEVIRLCRREEVPYCILGNGSNLLVGDGGFDGVVISMTAGFSGCTVDSDRCEIAAGAGASLSRVGKAALEAGLTGFEFGAWNSRHGGRSRRDECGRLRFRDEGYH